MSLVLLSSCGRLRPVLSNHYQSFIRRLATRQQIPRQYGRHGQQSGAALYATAAALVTFAAAYAAVPLYKIYCQATGKGGQAFIDEASEKIAQMTPTKDRVITITMEADTGSTMAWNFKPLHPEMKVIPGETALAFYSAKNPLKTPVTGIATYTVLPFEAGVYLNKIQCFCFEEQRLNPGEEVELPIFFYIDPEYTKDPLLENVSHIVLHYTFHESKDALQLPFIEKLTGDHFKTIVQNKQ